jgi:hypothetical protein
MQAVNNLNKGVVIAVAVIAVIAAIVMGVYFLKGGNTTAAGTITANDKPDYVKQMQSGQKPASYGQQYGQAPRGSGPGAGVMPPPRGGYGASYGSGGGYGGGAPR